MNNPAGGGATPQTGQQPGATQQVQSQGPNDPIQNPPESGGAAPATGSQQGEGQGQQDRSAINQAEMVARLVRERDEARQSLEAEKRKGLSEDERKRLADLDEDAKKRDAREKNLVLRYEIAARAPKLGIVDPEIAVLLLSTNGSVVVNDDLTVTGLDEALKNLIKERPHLVNRAPSSGDIGAGAGSGGSRTGNKPTMNDIIRGTVRRGGAGQG